MDEQTAERFRKRAIQSAKQRGANNELSEDLAHDLLLSWLSNENLYGQTIDQGITDAYRRISGRRGLPNYQLRRALAQTTQGMDALENRANHSNSADDLLAFEQSLELITVPTRRAVLCLRFMWGFKEKEIAFCFGFSESRASQIISEGCADIKRGTKKEEGRIQKGLSSQKQRGIESESTKEIPREIQIRSTIQKKTKGKMESFLANKKQGMAERTQQEISEALFKSFEIATF